MNFQNTEDIRKELLSLSNAKLKDFYIKLIPNIDKKTILGIYTSSIIKIAKNLWINNNQLALDFFNFEHRYYEENLLCSYILNEIDDVDLAIDLLNKFIFKIDNWAVCDAIKIKAFFNQNNCTIGKLAKEYIIKNSDNYVIRLGINFLRQNLQSNNKYLPKSLNWLTQISNKDYYVQMAIAWYLQVVYINYKDDVKALIKNNKLDANIIKYLKQKIRDSRAIKNEDKLV